MLLENSVHFRPFSELEACALCLVTVIITGGCLMQTSYFGGFMQGVRLWNKTLGAGEVATVFNRDRSFIGDKTDQNLLLSWVAEQHEVR
jgi:hypothetical protein